MEPTAMHRAFSSVGFHRVTTKISGRFT